MRMYYFALSLVLSPSLPLPLLLLSPSRFPSPLSLSSLSLPFCHFQPLIPYPFLHYSAFKKPSDVPKRVTRSGGSSRVGRRDIKGTLLSPGRTGLRNLGNTV